MYEALKRKISVKPTRQCGSCTACCDGYLVATAQNKKIQDLGKPCIFLKNHSCSVYDYRPIGCNEFFCLYITDLSIPDYMKPDISKTMLIARTVENINFLDIIECGSLLSNQILEWIYENFMNGIYENIRFEYDKKTYFLTKKEELFLEVKSSSAKENIIVHHPKTIDYFKDKLYSKISTIDIAGVAQG